MVNIMLNVAICDDDIQTTGKLDMMLQNIARKNYIDIDTDVLWDGKALVEAVQNGSRFDMIYLDIEMFGQNGIEAAKCIRKFDKNVLIIYVSSHETYMKDSFSVRPFQFLVKPVGERQFESCFKDAYEEICSEDKYFRYSYQRINHKVLIRDILYFESNKRIVSIITDSCNNVFYGKLNCIEEELKGSKISFLRIHQSFLVNYRHIESIAYNYVVVDNGKHLSISEDRRKMISEQYCAIEDKSNVS